MSIPDVTPWTGRAAPTQVDIERLLRGEGLAPNWWSNGPLDRYNPHSHAYRKVLYCAQGDITFVIPGAGEFRLRPGDRLDIPPGTVHSAIVGPDGVTCAEAAKD